MTKKLLIYSLAAMYDGMNCVQESHLEESGWKMVHGDVFRPPNHPKLLSSLVGSGIQILAMFALTIGKYLF